MIHRTLLPLTRIAATAVMAALLGSCGGGGSTEPTVPPVVATLSAAKFTGAFLGACETVPGASVELTGAPLYGRLYQVVGTASGASAGLQWRLDLYATTDCSGSALGYVENNSATSLVTVVGQTSVGGKTVDKVLVQFGAATSALVTAAALAPVVPTVTIGTNVRLTVPSQLFSAFQYQDIWYVESGILYEGGDATAADGFPRELNLATPSSMLSGPLPRPLAACAATTASWQVAAANCSASLPSSASGTLAQLLDNSAPTTGAAAFSCSNGVWSAPTSKTCTDNTPPPPTPAPTPTGCVTESLSWTVGAYSCSGPVPGDSTTRYSLGTSWPTTNTLAGNSGTAFAVCTDSGRYALDSRFLSYNTCGPTPPPPPPITDPMQLAVARNCMLCHALTTASVGPSFKAIADYYRTTPPAAGALESKITFGGIGTFGNVPMPSNAQASSADLAILVPWILSQ